MGNTSDELESSRVLLPLDARSLEVTPRGFTVRLPVREEQIQVTRQAFVTEEVIVRRGTTQDVVHGTTTVRREELDLDVEGDVDVTRPWRPSTNRPPSPAPTLPNEDGPRPVV